MRKIDSKVITDTVKDMCIEAAIFLGDDVKNRLKKSIETEKSETGKNILNILLENADKAEKKNIPICQDTGMAVFFVKVGQDVIV